VTELAEYGVGNTWEEQQRSTLAASCREGMAQRSRPNYVDCVRMEGLRGPGCWVAVASQESDATAVDSDCGYIECGHATVVAELVD
jgi:hypothetical protein